MLNTSPMNTNCFVFYAKNITTSTLPSSKFSILPNKILKILKIFNFWSSERHQSLLGNGRVVTKVNAVNFWNSERHHACLFGRVVTRVNAVNSHLIFFKKHGQSSLFTLLLEALFHYMISGVRISLATSSISTSIFWRSALFMYPSLYLQKGTKGNFREIPFFPSVSPEPLHHVPI